MLPNKVVFMWAGVALLAIVAGPASLADSRLTGAPPDATALVEPHFPSSPPSEPEGPLRFERISLEQGLSQSSVNCILQDRQGFLWFGTEDGLNKYDGYTFTHYRNVPGDPHSLSHNHILAMIEDDQGTLWVGTNGGGLNRFDRHTERFTRYGAGSSLYEVSGGFIHALYQDRDGGIWIGSPGGGLIQFDRQKGHFVHYHHRPGDPNSLGSNSIWAITQDRDGALWIGTDGGGLNRFDPATRRFTRYTSAPNDPHSLSSNSIRAIVQDRDGTLWVGTDGGGLNGFDPATGRSTRYQHDPHDPDSLGGDSVRAILLDKEGVVWIGTFGGGLDTWDSANPGRFIHHRHDLNDPHSLSNDEVWSIVQDREGLLWVGTHGGGVNKLDRSTESFAHYYARPDDPYSLSDNMVWAIYEDEGGNGDRAGTLWIGTSGGVDRIDRSTGKVTHYHHVPGDPSSLSGDVVRAIHEDRDGALWLGAEDGGLDKLDRASGRFTHYTSPGSPASVLTIYEDQDGVLWLGMEGGGLRWFNLETERFFTRKLPESQCVPGRYVRTIYSDRSGKLWIGDSGGGLSVIDWEQNRCTAYRHDPDDPGSLSHNMVMAIHEDREEVLWVATFGGGLNRLNRETGTFTHYREEDGLPNDMVYGILEDEGEGTLWLSTNRGLACFDPRTERFKQYGVKDGLQSDEFNGGAYYRSSSGEMFFGGINGFNAFYPGDIRAENMYVPPIVLTYLAQGGEPVVLDTSVEALQELVVRWPSNFFEFEFAALSYTRPEKNEYAYMLEGLEKDWIYTGNRRFGRYTNLPGGRHLLRLKGSNNDGVWNETGAAITVRVIPPFWATWWFRGILFLAVIGAVVGGYRLRVRSVEARSRALERQVAQRTAELEQEIDQRLQVEEALRESEMEQAVAAERSRLARDLHDVVTQTLFSASLIAEALPTSWERDRVEGQKLLHELQLLTRGALAEMRTLLLELRPAALMEADLDDLMRQLAEAATGREGIPVAVDVDGVPKLPSDVHIALYRIAQEALNNVTKHACAHQASIHLSYERLDPPGTGTRVRLRIADDGRGFVPHQVSADRMGLCSMRERAQAIGATLTIHSQAGRGTEVVVVWEDET